MLNLQAKCSQTLLCSSTEKETTFQPWPLWSAFSWKRCTQNSLFKHEGFFFFITKSIVHIKNARGMFNLPKRGNHPKGYTICFKKYEHIACEFSAIHFNSRPTGVFFVPYFYYHSSRFANVFIITLKLFLCVSVGYWGLVHFMVSSTFFKNSWKTLYAMKYSFRNSYWELYILLN